MGSSTRSIMSLLNLIHTDRQLVLPDIQRDFVWSRDQIRLLMDSLMRGYPFGALLFWQTRFLDVAYRQFVQDYSPDVRHLPKQKEAGTPLLMVLDGQQRLQSLYLAIHGSHDSRRLYFNVTSGDPGSDAEELGEGLGAAYRFEFWKDEERNRPLRLIPVSRIMGWSPRTEDDEIEHVTKEIGLGGPEARQAAKNIRLLRQVMNQSDLVPIEVIDEEASSVSTARNIDDVLEIFVRVNTGGTRLSRSDLMFSLIKRHWGGARTAFDDLVAELQEKVALGIDKDFLIRGLLTVADAPPTYKIENIKNHWEKMAEVFQEFAEALRASIDFVQAPDVGIQSRSLLDPLATLFPLVYYVYHQPSRSVPDQQRRPLRALTYFLLFNKFLARPEARIGYLRTELAATPGRALPLERLLHVIETRQKWHWVETVIGMLEENIPLTLSIAQRRVARETLSWQQRPEVDHIFPQSTYGHRYPQEVYDIGNLAYLGKLQNIRKSKQPPWEYFASLDDRELMDDYLIDRSLLREETIGAFVKDRRDRIVERVKDFLGR